MCLETGRLPVHVHTFGFGTTTCVQRKVVVPARAFLDKLFKKLLCTNHMYIIAQTQRHNGFITTNGYKRCYHHFRVHCLVCLPYAVVCPLAYPFEVHVCSLLAYSVRASSPGRRALVYILLCTSPGFVQT